MGILDIVLGGFLCYGMYKGFKNGLFIELASLLSLILGIFIAIKFSFLVGAALQNNFGWTSRFVPIIAFVITFLLVVFGIRIIANLFTNIANFAFLGWLNKLGGAVFSVLKTILILSIVFNIFQKININNQIVKQETIDQSVFFNPIQEISGLVYPSLGEWYESLKKQTKREKEE